MCVYDVRNSRLFAWVILCLIDRNKWKAFLVFWRKKKHLKQVNLTTGMTNSFLEKESRSCCSKIFPKILTNNCDCIEFSKNAIELLLRCFYKIWKEYIQSPRPPKRWLFYHEKIWGIRYILVSKITHIRESEWEGKEGVGEGWGEVRDSGEGVE